MSNCDGEVEVIEKVNGKTVKVRFLNTGYERLALIDNVRAGKVRDLTIADRSKVWNDSELKDSFFTNNSGQEFKIIQRTGNACIVQFTETGYTKAANINNIKAGKVRDPYHISVYSVGYDGEFERLSYWRQARQLWQNMLKRCYSTKDPKGYYGKGISVDARWLCFANFMEDLPKLENFNLWISGQKEGKGKYNLDKDKKIEGNKVYSREACMFLTEYENKSAGAINARLLDKIKMGNT